MDKIVWNLSPPLSLSVIVSKKPRISILESQITVCVSYVVGGEGGGDGGRKIGGEGSGLSRTSLKPCFPACGKKKHRDIFYRKIVGMANFSRWWATWKIATKLSHGAGLHGPSQLQTFGYLWHKSQSYLGNYWMMEHHRYSVVKDESGLTLQLGSPTCLTRCCGKNPALEVVCLCCLSLFAWLFCPQDIPSPLDSLQYHLWGGYLLWSQLCWLVEWGENSCYPSHHDLCD